MYLNKIFEEEILLYVPKSLVIRAARVFGHGATPAGVVGVVGDKVSPVDIRGQNKGDAHNHLHHSSGLWLDLRKVQFIITGSKS